MMPTHAAPLSANTMAVLPSADSRRARSYASALVPDLEPIFPAFNGVEGVSGAPRPAPVARPIRAAKVCIVARQTAFPPTLPPRLVPREVAAAYLSISANTFDEMVKDGTMPRPKQLRGNRIAWDVRALDGAVDRLPVNGESQAGDTSWSDVDAT
jgi:predicted DNA-binding transcriptional regulator AlpA